MSGLNCQRLKIGKVYKCLRLYWTRSLGAACAAIVQKAINCLVLAYDVFRLPASTRIRAAITAYPEAQQGRQESEPIWTFTAAGYRSDHDVTMTPLTWSLFTVNLLLGNSSQYCLLDKGKGVRLGGA